MEKEVSFENSFGEKLKGYLHVPKNKIDKGIVLAHCFTCSRHQKIMRETCDMLAEESGFLVLRFDFSGNGESEGNFEEANYSKEMTDLGHAITYVMEKGAKSVGLIGHSMGAAVSILQSSMDERVRSLCVIAGASDTESIKSVFPKDKLDEIYKKGKAEVEIFGSKFDMVKEFFVDAENHDIQKALKRFDRPFCIVHGDKDEIIACENAKRLFKYSPEPKEIHIVKGADHMFTDKSKFKELKKIVKEWFERTCE